MRSGVFSEVDEENLLDVIRKLAQGKSLDPKYKDHSLSGNWKNFRECHIKPDLLLIYQIKNDTLYLVRLGSHGNLF